jgi:hypothetical protein
MVFEYVFQQRPVMYGRWLTLPFPCTPACFTIIIIIIIQICIYDEMEEEDRISQLRRIETKYGRVLSGSKENIEKYGYSYINFIYCMNRIGIQFQAMHSLKREREREKTGILVRSLHRSYLLASAFSHSLLLQNTRRVHSFNIQECSKKKKLSSDIFFVCAIN